MEVILTFINRYFIYIASLVALSVLILAIIRRFWHLQKINKQNSLYLPSLQNKTSQTISLIFIFLGFISWVLIFILKLNPESYFIGFILCCGGTSELITPSKPTLYLSENQIIINYPETLNLLHSEIRRLYLYESGIFIVIDSGKRLEYSFDIIENQCFINKLRQIANTNRQIHFIDNI